MWNNTKETYLFENSFLIFYLFIEFLNLKHIRFVEKHFFYKIKIIFFSFYYLKYDWLNACTVSNHHTFSYVASMRRVAIVAIYSTIWTEAESSHFKIFMLSIFISQPKMTLFTFIFWEMKEKMYSFTTWTNLESNFRLTKSFISKLNASVGRLWISGAQNKSIVICLWMNIRRNKHWTQFNNNKYSQI